MKEYQATHACGSKKTSKAREQAIIMEPHAHDVLRGKGKKINSHAGNQHFRFFVKKLEEACALGPKESKPFYANYIIKQIESLDPPGRFLKQDKNTGMWHEVSKKKRKEKTLQALREKAPKILKRWKGKSGSDTEDCSHMAMARTRQQAHLHYETGSTASEMFENELDEDVDSVSPPPPNNFTMSSETSNAYSPNLSNVGTNGSLSTPQTSDTSGSIMPPFPQNMTIGNPSSLYASQIASSTPHILPMAHESNLSLRTDAAMNQTINSEVHNPHQSSSILAGSTQGPPLLDIGEDSSRRDSFTSSRSSNTQVFTSVNNHYLHSNANTNHMPNTREDSSRRISYSSSESPDAQFPATANEPGPNNTQNNDDLDTFFEMS
jgi:hypothetical protein